MENIFSENPTFAVGIIIGLFGILATHRLMGYRERMKLFNVSANEFREVFNKVLVNIQSGNYGFGNPIDIDIIKTNKIAYLNFRPHFHGICRDKYDEAWKKYYDDCASMGAHGIFKRKTRFDVERDIENLLQFTEHSLFKNMKFIYEKYKHKNQNIKLS